MKAKIHPPLYDVVFIDSSSDAQFIGQSTRKSEKTMKIDGKEYYIIKAEITSNTHPFYTGKQNLIDTAGRVDKFRAKWDKAAKLREEPGEEKAEEPKKDEPKKEEAKVEEVKEVAVEETPAAEKEVKEVVAEEVAKEAASE